MPAKINDAALDAAFDVEPEPVGACDKCGGELLGEEIETGLCVYCELGIDREDKET